MTYMEGETVCYDTVNLYPKLVAEVQKAGFHFVDGLYPW